MPPYRSMLATLIFRNYLFSKRSGALVRIIAWHCLLGIGMGVAALIIVLSVMNGFNITIRNRMLSFEPHLILPFKNHPEISDLKRLKNILATASHDGVESVERYESQDLILRSVDGMFGGTMAKGYDQRTIHDILDRVWRSSHRDAPPPQRESSELAPDEIVLGVDLARSLGLFEGDDVILVPPEMLLLPKGEIPKFQKFKVKSLISTQMPEFDSKLMFYNLDKFPERVRSLSREAGFEVRLKNPYEAEAVKERLAVLKMPAQTWGERDTSLFFALKLESGAMTLFLSLAVLITSFSIVIIMVLLMSQKRQDIGMLMALGLSAQRTKYLFLRVGLLLSFVGVMSGVILGTAVCLILDHYPLELLPDIYTDSTLPAKLSPNILIGVLLGSSVVAILGSWLPVWRTVLTQPAECLRKESGAKG